jgi:uncharacterized membrane protein (Fun14 family)
VCASRCATRRYALKKIGKAAAFFIGVAFIGAQVRMCVCIIRT